jgi:hypothetical protein
MKQVWEWKKFLDPFERSRLKLLEKRIAEIDAERIRLAAERLQLVSRGRNRAKVKAVELRVRSRRSNSDHQSPSTT